MKRDRAIGIFGIFGILFLSAFVLILILSYLNSQVFFAPTSISAEKPTLQDQCTQTKSGAYTGQGCHAECVPDSKGNSVCTKVPGPGVDTCTPVGAYCKSPYVCTDNDDGQDFFEDSWVHVTLHGDETTNFIDHCISDEILLEYYCTTPDASVASGVYQNCSNVGAGYGCSGGKCVPAEQVAQFHCTDTDGGYDAFTPGTVTVTRNDGVPPVTYTDYCLPNNVLVENICLGSGGSQYADSYQLNCSRLGSHQCTQGKCLVYESYILGISFQEPNEYLGPVRVNDYTHHTYPCGLGMKVGDSCYIGRSILKLTNFSGDFFAGHQNYASAEIASIPSSSNQGVFNKLFDQFGNYIMLPTAEQFPMNNISIKIYNMSGQIIANYDYGINLTSISLLEELPSSNYGQPDLYGFAFDLSYLSVRVISPNSTQSILPLYYAGSDINYNLAFQGTGSSSISRLSVSNTSNLTYSQLSSHIGDKNLVLSYSNF